MMCLQSLFTNVSLNESIDIIAKKAFTNNWLIEQLKLNICETDLVQLLHIVKRNQLIQINDNRLPMVIPW